MTTELELGIAKLRQETLPLITQCREGRAAGNGHNLWVRTNTLRGYGISYEDFGVTPAEVRGYLVQDARSWLEEIRSGNCGSDISSWHLIALYVDFFDLGDRDSDIRPKDESLLEEIGTSVDDIRKLNHIVDIRAAQEELERCRKEGPSLKFYGLNSNLLTGSTTLEEIGVTQEEVDRFTLKYTQDHPYSTWSDLTEPKTIDAARTNFDGVIKEEVSQKKS